ncbi:hypothetical protein ACVPOW_14945 [Staphylococcus aureus]
MIGIFKSEDPEKFAKAIVQATTHYQDYELIGKCHVDWHCYERFRYQSIIIRRTYARAWLVKYENQY